MHPSCLQLPASPVQFGSQTKTIRPRTKKGSAGLLQWSYFSWWHRCCFTSAPVRALEQLRNFGNQGKTAALGTPGHMDLDLTPPPVFWTVLLNHGSLFQCVKFRASPLLPRSVIPFKKLLARLRSLCPCEVDLQFTLVYMLQFVPSENC